MLSFSRSRNRARGPEGRVFFHDCRGPIHSVGRSGLTYRPSIYRTLRPYNYIKISFREIGRSLMKGVRGNEIIPGNPSFFFFFFLSL